MSILTNVYSRLNDASITATVSNRIYPTDPQRGTDWPFLVYRVTNTNPVTSLAGISGLTSYTVQIDVWAKTLATLDSLANAIIGRLHCYRGGNVMGSFLSEQSNEQLSDDTEGDIYHTAQTFDVWCTTANVQATADSTGVVQTGNNSASLSACSNTLTVDCSGLKYNGKPVSIFAPKLTLITDWTVHFTTSPNPERLGVFKYVKYRSKPHRKFTTHGYTPHKGKRYEQVWELSNTATSWTFPTSYANSIRPHDNDPWILSPLTNLRASRRAKQFKLAAMHGGQWHLSPLTLRFNRTQYEWRLGLS